ncbi:MAG: class I SAM-dependent methyltransferase [Phycisphaeraceae bacterium]
MGLYGRYVFPWVLDRAMGREPMEQRRPGVLGDAKGEVLEIGFGTGRNLPYYPAEIDHLTVLEPSEPVARRAEQRLRESPIKVESVRLGADQALPLDTARFDTIVSTWTMCSIDDLPRALHELHRVLKPGGRLLFIEHGLARTPKLAKWQHRLTPINRWIGQGCRLNRDFKAILHTSPLQLEQCEEFEMPSTPRIASHHYRGTAVKR